MSELVSKGPCDACGSSDACATYDDGHTHCHKCGARTYSGKPSGEFVKRKPGLIHDGRFGALTKRRISADTCRKFGYQTGTYNGKQVQIAPYFKDGELVAQKLRFTDKSKMPWLGDSEKPGFFGQQLWSRGKKLVITEGEIDALTVSQMQGNKWPVVSIPQGCDSAAKVMKRELEWLQGFDEIILMFDQDEPGRKAAQAAAEVLPVGKVKIAQLPHKDPNDCLVAGEGEAIIQAIWNAAPWRPDGILNGSDLWDLVADRTPYSGVPYPYHCLNELLHGLRKHELVTITAGSGVGKSALIREIAGHLVERGERVGMLMLEESVKRTALAMVGRAIDKPLLLGNEGVPDEELRRGFDATLGTGRLFLYDHFGSTQIENLLNRIRYMAKACECDWIFLDHLSIVVSGLGDGDERRLIDNAMTAIRMLVQETGIGMIIVSHLKRPEGKGHEEGGQTSLSQLRGSAAIAQLSDIVIGCERDQQGDSANTTTLRVLKNRYSGQTGIAGYLEYDPATGRLGETAGGEWDEFESEEEEDPVSDQGDL